MPRPPVGRRSRPRRPAENGAERPSSQWPPGAEARNWRTAPPADFPCSGLGIRSKRPRAQLLAKLGEGERAAAASTHTDNWIASSAGSSPRLRASARRPGRSAWLSSPVQRIPCTAVHDIERISLYRLHKSGSGRAHLRTVRGPVDWCAPLHSPSFFLASPIRGRHANADAYAHETLGIRMENLTRKLLHCLLTCVTTICVISVPALPSPTLSLPISPASAQPDPVAMESAMPQQPHCSCCCHERDHLRSESERQPQVRAPLLSAPFLAPRRLSVPLPFLFLHAHHRLPGPSSRRKDGKMLRSVST